MSGHASAEAQMVEREARDAEAVDLVEKLAAWMHVSIDDDVMLARCCRVVANDREARDARVRAEARREALGAIRRLAGAPPDCGDNGCRFGGAGKGGMRTNGGCRCLRERPSSATRIYFERLAAAARALMDEPRDAEEEPNGN